MLKRFFEERKRRKEAEEARELERLQRLGEESTERERTAELQKQFIDYEMRRRGHLK